MKYFHGTTDLVVDKILASGLWDWSCKQPAWLSASFDDAVVFASLRAAADSQFKSVFPESVGGLPVVVSIDVPDEAVVRVEPFGIYAKTVIPTNYIIDVQPVTGAVYASLKKRSLFYQGWMGVMETAQFLQRADDATIAEFKKLVEAGQIDQAWLIVEKYWDLPHHELTEQPKVEASLVLYASLERFATPILTGISADEVLTDSLGKAVTHKGYQVVAVKVPASFVEGVPSDDDSDTDFYVPKASISPLFVRAVYNPWVQRQFKVTANSVSFALEDLLNVVTDRKELEALQVLIQAHGEVQPRQQAAFLNRITPYLSELLRKSAYRYPLEHLFGIIHHGMMIQDGCGNYSYVRTAAELEDSLQLSVGDIVKDINTNTQGEVIAISKMHHEADIDIVVRWEQPINGQTTFEVHPNEIKFVRHKTEPEVMEDVDWRYYEESLKENKGLKTRLDYGIRREAGQFYQPGQFQLVWDNYTPGLDYYRGLGHIQTEDKVMYWAVDNDTPSGDLQLIDPEDVNDGLVDFRTIVKEEYENASEMISEATQMILEVSNARFERVKTSPPSEPRPKRHKPGEAKEEAFEEEEIGEGTGESAGAEARPSTTPIPPGAPTKRKPHLNGLLANDEGSKCVPFLRAYAIWVRPLKRWQILVYYREPTIEDPMASYTLEVEDYLNRRSLCMAGPEQPST